MPRFKAPVVSTADIIDGSITTAKLADGAVTTPKVDSEAITTAKLADLAVEAAKLAADAVETDKVADGAVTTIKLDDLSVTTAKIGLLAVGAAQIANLAVTTGKIANLAVTDAKIDSISADKITAGDLTVTVTLASSGTFRTGSSGAHVQITASDPEDIAFIDSDGSSEVGGLGVQTAGSPDGLVLFTNAGRLLAITGGSGAGIALGGITDGSALSPAVKFVNDLNLGLFRSGTDTLSMSLGGTQLLSFSPSSSTGHARITFDGVAATWIEATRSGTTDTLTLTSNDNIDLTTNKIRVTGGTLIELTQAGTLVSYVQENYGWEMHGDSNHPVQVSGGSLMLGDKTSSGSVSTGSNLFIGNSFDDIGNHEVLRADRGGGPGWSVTAVGYYSSSRASKREIVPLGRSKLWRLEWIDRLEPVKYRRRSTQGREFGFVLENLADVSPHLTTKGDAIGNSPDEFALHAIEVLAIQDLRRRVAALEAA